MAKQTLIERFEKYVKKSPSCWFWTGALTSYRKPKPSKRCGGMTHGSVGYGSFTINGKHSSAHRTSLLIYKNIVVPKGKAVHHRCQNNLCVNPGHLAVVSPAENSKRENCHRLLKRECGHAWTDGHCPVCYGPKGRTLGPTKKPHTHCRKGHKYTTKTIYLRPHAGGGWRMCKICMAQWAKNRMDRNRAATQVRRQGRIQKKIQKLSDQIGRLAEQGMGI